MAYQSKEDLFCVRALYQAIKQGDAMVSLLIIVHFETIYGEA